MGTGELGRAAAWSESLTRGARPTTRGRADLGGKPPGSQAEER
jgi:hypothetical protein